MKNLTKLTALLLSFMILLSGCSFLGRPDPTGLPFSFELAYDEQYEMIRHGRLVYTVTKFWTVDNVADLPEKGGIRDDGWASYCTYDENGMGVAMLYPECVQEDGSFAENGYLVMVEFTVTSEDAENWTSNDYREGFKEAGRGPRGKFEDPYIFNVMEVFEAFWAGGSCASSSVAYFSELFELSNLGNGYDYRIEPGEERTMVLGFFVSINDKTGEMYIVQDLALKVYDRGYPVSIPVRGNLTEE